ncbi:MAG: hypothetical protein ACD_7C00115G0004 [uncultured bacterium]|nr:MAG: hypothetical protein ACD_7C00115G0004 [uncultured bacterium]
MISQTLIRTRELDMKKDKLKNAIHLGINKLQSALKSFFGQEYFRSHIIIWLLILSFIINTANWLSLNIWVKPVDFSIILHYNVYFGVDSIGDYREVYILPIIGLILFFINFVLSLYFYQQKERIASYILLIATLMIQLSLAVASTSIILINY